MKGVHDLHKCTGGLCKKFLPEYTVKILSPPFHPICMKIALNNNIPSKSLRDVHVDFLNFPRTVSYSG
jgi:hypothetical protein